MSTVHIEGGKVKSERMNYVRELYILIVSSDGYTVHNYAPIAYTG